MCDRRVLSLVALNLELYWDGVIVFPAIYGADATLQFSGIGYG